MDTISRSRIQQAGVSSGAALVKPMDDSFQISRVERLWLLSMMLWLIGIGGLFWCLWDGFCYLQLRSDRAIEADAHVSSCHMSMTKGDHGVIVGLTFLVPNGGTGQVEQHVPTFRCEDASRRSYRVRLLADAPEYAMTIERYQDTPARELFLAAFCGLMWVTAWGIGRWGKRALPE